MKTLTIIAAIIVLLMAYPYYAYVKYQKMVIKFRAGLHIGARVKFLHHKKPLQGTIARIFANGSIYVKESTSGILYMTTKKNIYPMIGGEAKTTKTTKKK